MKGKTILIVGHVDSGKTTLSAAISTVLAAKEAGIGRAHV